MENNLEISLGSSFEHEVNLTLVFGLVNKLNLYNYQITSKLEMRIYQNGLFYNSLLCSNLDFSILSKNDQHYFGFSQSNKEEIIFFNIIDYTVTKNLILKRINYEKITNYKIFPAINNQRRFNENNTLEVLSFTKDSEFSSY